MEYKNLSGQLWNKLSDKNYDFIDIFKFLRERFIPLPPIVIHNPYKPSYERETYEMVYKPFLEDALIEVDYLKHK